MERVDVLIIGAGLLGCFTARNLARYEADILVLEKEKDVCGGISKANTGIIYPGYDNSPGSLKSKLCVQANEAFDALTRELEVPFSRPGSLMISCGPAADRVIRRKYADGVLSGVKGLALLTGDEAGKMEPGLTDKVTSALYSRNTGTVNPWELCIAAYENAASNGARFRFGSRVMALRKENGGFYVETEDETWFAKAVVNAAGLYSDQIREMIRPPLLRLYPTAADYIVLDPSENGKINHIIFFESEHGKAVTLVPTVDGNILAGPTDREPEPDGISEMEFRVNALALDSLRRQAAAVVPSIHAERQIRAFASLRPNPYRVREEAGRIIREDTRIRDFTILEEDGLISLIGIKTPGLTFANELGRLTAEKAAAFAGRTTLRTDFDPCRKAIPKTRMLSPGERAALIGKDPGFGEIICGCMEVSRSEILMALDRGAVDFDGIRRRTGAGMGRCQGSRCKKRIQDYIHERQI